MLLVRPAAEPLSLGYCTNVHPAHSVADIANALLAHAVPLRERLGCDELVVGLHLGAHAVHELHDAAKLSALAQFLQTHRLRVVSLNVFPQRPFHSAVVKHAVYEPDWSTLERRDYTLAAARCLLALAPADASPLSLSTLPLGHASLRAKHPDIEILAATRLMEVARDFATLERSHGRTLRLALEPEPGCLLETAADLARFYGKVLLPAAVASGLGAKLLQRHIGACFDCCHGAVMFETPETAVRALNAVGCRVYKIQISAALEADLPAAAEALHACAEPRYLHQTSLRKEDGVTTVDDLHLLEPGACGTARTHFHIPIHAQPANALRSTASSLPHTLKLLEATGCTHYEVETYTFDVLPESVRAAESLIENLARELETAASWLQKSS
ncbi:MAG: xylose isomerase [Planctomycetes bacterium]|nr:xylose isomerase [Planctomycetota bacterium]